METPAELLRKYTTIVETVVEEPLMEKYNGLNLIESAEDRIAAKRQALIKETHQLLVTLKNNKLDEEQLDELVPAVLGAGARALGGAAMNAAKNVGTKALGAVKNVGTAIGGAITKGAQALAGTQQQPQQQLANPMMIGMQANINPTQIQAQITQLKQQQIQTQKQYNDQLKALTDQLKQASQVRPT